MCATPNLGWNRSRGSRATYAGKQLAVAATFFGCHLATATPGGTLSTSAGGTLGTTAGGTLSTSGGGRQALVAVAW